MIPIPGFLRKRVLWTIGETERIKGSAGTIGEICAVFQMNFTAGLNCGHINALVQNMFREGKIYTENFEFYSLSKDGPGKEKFENMSEKFDRLYKGYRMNSLARIDPLPETKTVNLQDLVSLLRSSDAEAWESNKWMYDGTLRFLDNKPIIGNKIALASFPRSGNTFLRKYTDLLTGIHTGSDNTLHVNVQLQMVGMIGEDTVDDKTWIVKTHSPWCMPFAPRFTCNKIMIIVRNPLDAFMSWLELVQHGNHATKSDFELSREYPEYWDWWIKDICEIYARWFGVYLEDARKKNVPILFIRFEDLLLDPEPSLYKMMQFLIGKKDLTGTNGERRVKEVIAKGAKATQNVYRLKSTTLKFNSQVKNYNDEQLALVQDRLGDVIHTFGYAKSSKEPENPTGFFDYP